MLYKLKFDKLPEYNYYTSIPISIMLDIHKLVEDSLVLHKYKIDKNKVVNNKYQASSSKRIELSKINESSVILLHLDVYKNDIESIRDLIQYCFDNNKDLYIPMEMKYVRYNEPNRQLYNIVNEYEGEPYNLSFTVESRRKLEYNRLKRNLLLSNILD